MFKAGGAVCQTCRSAGVEHNNSLQADRPDGRRPELERYALMNSPAELLRSLRELAEDLRNDGSETAAFFEMPAGTIEESWPSNRANEQLERLASSGAIRQYASFTVGQNALYERCLLLANQLIASGPSDRA